MQLSQLLPHIDAEIARLQQARDILASLSVFPEFPDLIADKQTRGESKTTSKLLQKRAAEIIHRPATGGSSDAVEIESASAPGDASYQDDQEQAKQHRVHALGDTARPGRRSRLAIADTALRGAVPSGPVVASAEEVRKSQASKTAQASRAAEVRRAGTELVSGFQWRNRSSDVRNVDALLQRLMKLGDDEADRTNAS